MLTSTLPTSGRSADTATRVSAVERRDSEVADLFNDLRTIPADDPARDIARAAIAQHYLSMARGIASRYANRGEPLEDLQQAALLGLVKAINGFDPDLGYDFVAYAMPMMSGEVKRHFRDKTWAVRVPRRHQERRAELNGAIRRLTQKSGRPPTMRQLAAELRTDEEDLADLMEASAAYSALSLDAPAGDGGDERAQLGDTLGGLDQALERIVDRAALSPLLNTLSDRERVIVLLRFFGNKTQSEIAAQVGVSQMHVSRLLAAALRKLREGMLVEE